MKKILIVLSLIAPLAASASVMDDVAKIRSLLPAGNDLAQVQTAILHGSPELEAIEMAKTNYLVRDFNKDGNADLLVISEENPHLENYETNQPCKSVEEENCYIVYGKRALRFYQGQKDGSILPVFTNDKMVRGGDEGGVFGDPLEGLQIRANGSITLSVYGGSAWRWSYTDVMQFRKNEFYVVGQDSYYGWTGDLRADTKSVNLITGDVIETHQKHGDAPVRKKRYKIAVKPLVKVSDYLGQDNE